MKITNINLILREARQMIIQRNKFLLLIIVLSLLLFFQGIIVYAAQARPTKIINEAIEALEEMSSAEDSGAFKGLLEEAEGIAIFPSVVKVAIFGLGGLKGDGIIIRKDNQTNTWYGPAFIKIKSASIGVQIGFQSIALVLVITNRQGLEGFMKDNFTFGGTASITAGPIGRSLSADTDFELKASIYSYSISKGLYYGASLQGSTIRENSDANETFYGTYISNRTILETKISKNAEFLKLLALIKEISK